MQNIAGSKRTISLNKIRLDGDTQSRQSLDEEVIHEYAALMEAGKEFPPLLVVFDGADYWLVDGFHRRWSAIKCKIEKLKCIVVEGTREDARWLSYGVNIDHGLPRTNGDKKKAVIAALKHPQGAKKSDRQIAEHVGVSAMMVNKYRTQLESSVKDLQIPTREVTRNGTTYEQNTANIGKPKGEQVEAMPLPTRTIPTSLEPREVTPVERAFTEKTPYEQLCYWWEKADSAARTRFRNFIDGIS